MKQDIKTIFDVFNSKDLFSIDKEFKTLIDIEKLNECHKDSDFYKLSDVFYLIYKESLKGIFKANQNKEIRDPLYQPVVDNEISLTKLSSFSIKGMTIIIPKYFQFLSSDLLSFLFYPIKNFKSIKVKNETYPVKDIISRKDEAITKINWLGYNPIFNNVKIYFSQAKRDFISNDYSSSHLKKFESNVKEEDLLIMPSNLEFSLLLSKLSPSDIISIVTILLISWKRIPRL